MMSTQNKHRPFTIWPFVPAILLGFLMSIVGTMVFISTHDPGFAVEPDYYAKAVNWDQQAAQGATNEQLGWNVSWSFEPATPLARELTLTLALSDSGGPITSAHVSVKAFHNARANQIQTLDLRETSPGKYQATLQLHKAGLWELRLDASLNGARFTHKQQIELTPASLAHGGRSP